MQLAKFTANCEMSSKQLPKELQDITDCVRRYGYAMAGNFPRNQTTMDVGRSIGVVMDLPALMPQSGVTAVQTLRPRHERQSHSSQYSGTYGLSAFPLHTDLAHWACPPRYFLLRCKIGSQSVATRLLSYSALTLTLEEAVIQRAVVRPRHTPRNGMQCLLPLLFRTGVGFGFRWDSLFLVPMNKPAQRVADTMSAGAWDPAKLITFTLRNPGDTLIVDNWRFLHGRSCVPAADVSRRIERVYLSELYE